MAKSTQPKITRKKLTDYLPDDHNANAGTERGLQMIEDSLQQDGVGRSIVADANGRVPAGNKTLEAAMNAGITEVIEIETDGRALIVHKRTDWDLTDPTGAARRYAYRDNRAAEVGLSWSADQIAADVEAGVDLSYMFTPLELENVLINSIIDVNTIDDPGGQIDRAEELQAKWNVKRGDLWLIGEHRLLCGDSTNAEDVARVMGGEKARLVVTSPPYNQNLETFKPRGMQKESPAFVDRMSGSYMDSLPEDDYQQQQIDLLEMLPSFMTDDGSIFYNHKIRYRDKAVISPFMWLSKLSYPIRQEIIWDRGSSITLNARMLIPADERIYWLRVGDDFIFNDTVEIKSWSTVWEIGAHNEVSISAAFATEIPLRCIQVASVNGDAVIEPYCGSGTTLVACEQTGRKGRGLEIEPKYCAVILERMSGMGLHPQLSE